jgi:hypothetical protein
VVLTVLVRTMGSVVVVRRHHSSSLAGLLLALLVAACGLNAPATQSAAPSTTASSNPIATAQAASAEPSGSASVEGRILYIQDPALEMTLPEGWRPQSWDEIKAELASVPESAMSAEARAAFEAKFASGRVRAVLQGMTPGGVVVGVLVTVEPGISTTAAAVDFVTQEIDLSNEIESAETGTITTSIGEATWLRFILSLPPSDPDNPIEYVPAQALVYAILLGDDRVLLLQSSGTQDDPTYRDTIDAIVASIKAT